MNLRDLVTDADGTRLSHTKLWANVGYAAATYAFVKSALDGNISVDVWWAYLACVAGASTASKYLSLKYSSRRNEDSQ